MRRSKDNGGGKGERRTKSDSRYLNRPCVVCINRAVVYLFFFLSYPTALQRAVVRGSRAHAKGLANFLIYSYTARPVRRCTKRNSCREDKSVCPGVLHTPSPPRPAVVVELPIVRV